MKIIEQLDEAFSRGYFIDSLGVSIITNKENNMENTTTGGGCIRVDKNVRVFGTGATRDTNEGKLEYARFFSPEVLYYFAQYMHKNRFQSDGTLRDPDNWKKGMTRDVYMDSLARHYHDVWLHHEGSGDLATENLHDSLCGLMFNSMGYLYEETKITK